MDEPKVLEALNESLELQQRSTLQFTIASGSMFGLEMQGLTGQLWEFAEAELHDTRLLVEKITALGGDPTTRVGELRWHSDPHETFDNLIAQEEETIASLHGVIPHSGQEPRSEALEHLIMRKQNQVDWLRRARRQP